MMRSRSDRFLRWHPSSSACLLVLVLALVTPGCAWSDGDPWGQLDVSLETYMAPPASRLTAEGRLKTANSFALALDEVTIEVSSMSLVASESGGASATVTFDPSDPPPGYSLCHNGHCHKDDGSLPTYDEIRAELAEGAGGGASGVRELAVPGEPITVTNEAQEVALGPCPGDCWFERGEVTEAQLTLGSVHIRGRVFDQLTGDARRIPEAGLDVDIRVDVPFTLTQPMALTFGPDAESQARIQAVLSVPVTLFDGIDWALIHTAEPQDAALLLREQVTTAWLEAETSLSTNIISP